MSGFAQSSRDAHGTVLCMTSEAVEPIVAAISDAKFYEEMQKVRDLINARANGLEDKLSGVITRVAVLETIRETETRRAAKRQTLTVVGLTATVTSIWKLIDHYWKP